eukprot:gene22910-30087_t
MLGAFSLCRALRQVLASPAGSSARSALSSLNPDGVHRNLSQRAMSSSSEGEDNQAGPSGSPPTSAELASPYQPSAETSPLSASGETSPPSPSGSAETSPLSASAETSTPSPSGSAETSPLSASVETSTSSPSGSAETSPLSASVETSTPSPSAETSPLSGWKAAPTGTPSSSSGLRKLSDVLGHNIQIQPLAPKVSPAPVIEDELGEAVPAEAYTASEVSEVEDPAQRLIDPEYGFSVIGGVIPEPEDSSTTTFAAHPRVHPTRTFAPGQGYIPQDLNPFSTQEDGPSRFSGRKERWMPSVREAKTFADYKNVQFLEKYLSPAGRLLPRRETKLPVTLHVHVMRQIKLARSMGLIAGEARLDKLHTQAQAPGLELTVQPQYSHSNSLQPSMVTTAVKPVYLEDGNAPCSRSIRLYRSSC